MYFIRVNGNTAHNNPQEDQCFVPGEPPHYPRTYFNYYKKCLAEGFVRIGWPDVGDLRTMDRTRVLAHCYCWEGIKQHVRNYLESFLNIPLRSTVLMPNKDNPGELSIGTTTSSYYFSHNVPHNPYECAHRINVQWDPVRYHADELGINIQGGWWRRAFHHIEDVGIIDQIKATRKYRKTRR